MDLCFCSARINIQDRLNLVIIMSFFHYYIIDIAINRIIASEKMGSIINYSMYCKYNKLTILPWRITSLNPPPTLTFRLAQFRSAGHSCSLRETFVGKGKLEMFPVDQELVILDVVPIFGPFVKFETGQIEVCIFDWVWPIYF